ncbi:AMP-binding protein [Vibrio breoganii]
MNDIINNLLDFSDQEFCIEGSQKFTWKDAFQNVVSITKFFHDSGLNKDSVVAIDINKDNITYSAILACYCNGITFVPVDFISIGDSQTIPDIISPQVFLTSKKTYDMDEHNIVLISDLVEPIDFVDNDNRVAFISEPRRGAIAYIMQSSGSTGVPKVIPISYDNLHAYLDSVELVAALSSNTIFAQTVSLTFDLSIHDMFLSFRKKGTLLPLSASIAKFAPRFMCQYGAHNIMAVPSFYDLMASTGIVIPSVKNVFICGEALRKEVATKVCTMFPNADVYNFYGPTEATVAISYYKILSSNISDDDIVPIGRPFPGSKLLLSETGELLLGGNQIFSGYLEQNDKNPFVSIGRDIFYKSGDLCSFDGRNYKFLSRIDFQIKYRGYRLELEGVEATLAKHFEGDFAAIGFNQTSPGNFDDLAIFYDNIKISKSDLSRVLPRHFSGANFIFIDNICRNSSGKIDRKSLLRAVV